MSEFFIRAFPEGSGQVVTKFKQMRITVIILFFIFPALTFSQTTYEVCISDSVHCISFNAVEDEEGNILVPVGRADTIAWMPNNLNDGYLLKIDRYGDTVVRNYCFGDTAFVLSHIFVMSGNNYLVTGTAKVESNNEYMLLLMMVNAQLEKVWVKFHIFPGYWNYSFDKAYNMEYGFILAGKFIENLHVAPKYPLLIKIDHNGNIISSYSYPDGATERLEYLLSHDSAEI